MTITQITQSQGFSNTQSGEFDYELEKSISIYAQDLNQDIQINIDTTPFNEDNIIITNYQIHNRNNAEIKYLSYLKEREKGIFKFFIPKDDIEKYYKPGCPNSICKFIIDISSYTIFQLIFYFSFLSNQALENSISLIIVNVPILPTCPTCNIPEQDKIKSYFSEIQYMNSISENFSPLKIKFLSEDQISITQNVDASFQFSTLEPLIIYVNYQIIQKMAKSDNFKQYITQYQTDSSIYGQITYIFVVPGSGKGVLTISSKFLNGDFNEKKVRAISKYSYITNDIDFEAIKVEKDQNEEVITKQKATKVENDQNREVNSNKVEKDQNVEVIIEDKISQEYLILTIIIQAVVIIVMLLFFCIYCYIKRKRRALKKQNYNKRYSDQTNIELQKFQVPQIQNSIPISNQRIKQTKI